MTIRSAIHRLSLISALAISTAGEARAANFGFVRFPDWMDVYMLYGLGVLAVLWFLTAATKPAGVPFNQLYRTRLRGLNRLLYNLTLLTMIVLFGLLFIGMGLQRAAE